MLEELNPADLRPIFDKMAGTGTPQLQSYLNNHFQGHAGAMIFGNRVMPCVFGSTNAEPVIYAVPSVSDQCRFPGSFTT